jgi:hypothetical protein
MKARPLLTWVLALLSPLAMACMTFSLASAAAAQPAASASTPSCHGEPGDGHAGRDEAPASPCRPDCPLACAPISLGHVAVDEPLRLFARLRYDPPPADLRGRAPEPELPPPRTAAS